VLIDQFVKNFYQATLARQPNTTELQSWSSQLRQAYYQGQTQLRAAAQYMGRQIFKSPEYANRGRDDHNYVYDLYWAYLQRQPDAGGWGFWTNDVAANGRDHTCLAFETDGLANRGPEKAQKRQACSAAVRFHNPDGDRGEDS